MPRFLDTHGNTVLSIAICGRCSMKRAYVQLSSDPNYPGLMVCDQGCKDQFDPYRLPARQTERITLRWPRPDTPLTVDNDALITNPYNTSIISPEQANVPVNGNIDGLED
jgi:hypothetical protein